MIPATRPPAQAGGGEGIPHLPGGPHSRHEGIVGERFKKEKPRVLGGLEVVFQEKYAAVQRFFSEEEKERAQLLHAWASDADNILLDIPLSDDEAALSYAAEQTTTDTTVTGLWDIRYSRPVVDIAGCPKMLLGKGQHVSSHQTLPQQHPLQQYLAQQHLSPSVHQPTRQTIAIISMDLIGPADAPNATI
ncbi:hypothetical protein CSOJ01_13962 [Colletotrichum sojae]|uniref:Uncharacterized protein n=1 Tax=Colletotrichum sojae TaxID=2175907 RepID=A0A8H6IRF7_9PEZI|nr:hypothetical protein CSOJ01_13962 [Colletotrichum sojae]